MKANKYNHWLKMKQRIDNCIPLEMCYDRVTPVNDNTRK